MGDNILNRRIVRELVTRGDIKGDEIANNYNKFRYFIKAINYGGYSWCDNWQNATTPIKAFRRLLHFGVPIWFIRRHIKFIASNCVWFRGEARNIRAVLRVDDGGITQDGLPTDEVLSWFDGYHESIVYSLPITKDVRSNVSPFQRSDTFRVYTHRIYLLWSKVSDRYLAIHGLDCKMCGKHKKQSTIICEDLSKYKTDICADCLKGFCKLTDEVKRQTIQQFETKK